MCAWSVAVEPARFNEACDWFLKRCVVTEDGALELGLSAGQRAFWVGRGLQLTQIQRVFDKIDKAIASGEPFEDWRKRVKNELRDDAHAETVFRNATQRSYNAGRYQQMRDAQKWRPYWQFDGIHDSRQKFGCSRSEISARGRKRASFMSIYPPPRPSSRSLALRINGGRSSSSIRNSKRNSALIISRGAAFPDGSTTSC